MLAGLLLLTSPVVAFNSPAMAQMEPGAPPPVADPAAAPPAPLPIARDLHIAWEVKNRFRLFRSEADFQRQVAAFRGNGVLGAEDRLELAGDGRGWAKDVIDRLCVDVTGKLLDTCQRDKVRENYLAPEDHAVGVVLAGPVTPGSTCGWSFNDGTMPPQTVSTPCGEAVNLRVRAGGPTVASVTITAPDGTAQQATTEIAVHDYLIAGLGDSIASGEGNPDRPVVLSDDGFCFRRFLGASTSEYYRPGRAGYTGNKTCSDNPTDSGTNAANWKRYGARWMSAACHRSLYGYQLRAALALAVQNPQIAVTFLPLACSGATIDAGILGSQPVRECPLASGAPCPSNSPAQIKELKQLLAKARKRQRDRSLDLVLLTVGANDVRFSDLVADVIIKPGTERSVFNRAGLIATPAQANRNLDTKLPSEFAELRQALKPLVGGSLERVVYVSYGDPALAGPGKACAGGTDGFDIHPVFDANPEKLKEVTAFVEGKFLPQLKALALCEGGVLCNAPDKDRMTFVDSHQAAFAQHGVCAHSEDDPTFDKTCFLTNGKSFDSDLSNAAQAPLVCGLRPSRFRPYAHRARWIRTANDSYFTAMTYPTGLPNTMQPADIHDALWGATSAVQGGAIHPTAEGHAAMADAALPAMRAVLDIAQPPEVDAQPLPPINASAPAVTLPPAHNAGPARPAPQREQRTAIPQPVEPRMARPEVVPQQRQLAPQRSAIPQPVEPRMARPEVVPQQRQLAPQRSAIPQPVEPRTLRPDAVPQQQPVQRSEAPPMAPPIVVPQSVAPQQLPPPPERRESLPPPPAQSQRPAPPLDIAPPIPPGDVPGGQ
ncbi:MAG TPA: hypothetical protein VL402_02615 [Xanthobacteraceae bacterium]|jgi:hypothetical protein|nr:hypothetical protein [Xanthobacteraceae bacterium]